MALEKSFFVIRRSRRILGLTKRAKLPLHSSIAGERRILRENQRLELLDLRHRAIDDDVEILSRAEDAGEVVIETAGIETCNVWAI